MGTKTLPFYRQIVIFATKNVKSSQNHNTFQPLIISLLLYTVSYSLLKVTLDMFTAVYKIITDMGFS